MPGFSRIFALRTLPSLLVMALGMAGCSSTQPKAAARPAAPMEAHPSFAIPRIEVPIEVMSGLDVLEAEGFAPLRGRRFALLTHPAGADREGRNAIDVLRLVPGLHLVALFATEHGVYGNTVAGKNFPDEVDPRTGLMVFSLMNGRTHKPTRAQLTGIDALVIDLQDIGVRSYTFAGAMKEAMQGCFENNVEVIVLDRPNPLGGLKVDGPMLDPQWMGPQLVNEFPVPYVHGLTIGELARMAKYQPGVLAVPDAVRERGRLTVIPMRNWRRAMRWPDTGLAWVPTSQYIPDFGAAMGYSMTGLGCMFGGFRHGVGTQYPFRGVSHQTAAIDVVERDLKALHIPGLLYRRVSVTNLKTGAPGIGLYVEVADWDAWQPTELSFYLMQLACRVDPRNPFAGLTRSDIQLFLRHMGSTAFYRDIAAHGARVDVDGYLRVWQARDALYQQQSRRYWLYQ
jgi:uncharacterized protein YbbC (DUF1343 family)